jgi:hypothetical protein
MDYLTEYSEFQKKVDANTASIQEIGEMLMRMTGYYCNHNLTLADANIHFNKVASDISGTNDLSTGKGITSAKAEILARATPENDQYILAATHVKNLDVIIASLKKLQEGMTKEFSHA